MAESASRISVMLSNCQCLYGKEMMTSRAPSSVYCYRCGLVAYLTRFYTDLTHFHLRSHSY